jgi:hypothetical protein
MDEELLVLRRTLHNHKLDEESEIKVRRYTTQTLSLFWLPLLLGSIVDQETIVDETLINHMQGPLFGLRMR